MVNFGYYKKNYVFLWPEAARAPIRVKLMY